jgi:hypothetical protein
MVEQVNERWSVWCEHADGRHYRMGDARETLWSQETAERVAKHMTTYEVGTFVAQPCPPAPPPEAELPLCDCPEGPTWRWDAGLCSVCGDRCSDDGP